MWSGEAATEAGRNRTQLWSQAARPESCHCLAGQPKTATSHRSVSSMRNGASLSLTVGLRGEGACAHSTKHGPAAHKSHPHPFFPSPGATPWTLSWQEGGRGQKETSPESRLLQALLQTHFSKVATSTLSRSQLHLCKQEFVHS